jgi:iron complex transport system substrate-binding protein
MLRKLIQITLLIGLLAACSPQAAGPATEPAGEATLTFSDGLAREVRLDGPAQHVVSLAPSNTEILFAIGAGDQVVGRDQLSDFPEEAASLTDIGTTFDTLNTEAIVSLQPDLVLAAEINTPEQVKQLEDLGLTVYYLKNPLTLEEMYENLEIVAQLTGHTEEAVALIDSLKARVAAVDEKIAPLSSRFSVFYELDATDPAKPYTAGQGTFITQLIDRAGGFNIASELEGYPQMSLEQVVAADPAFIILGDARYGVTSESIAQRPGWENLTAVQNGNVLPFNDDLVSRPGPRLVDALEELAKLMRPELFE